MTADRNGIAGSLPLWAMAAQRYMVNHDTPAMRPVPAVTTAAATVCFTTKRAVFQDVASAINFLEATVEV